MVNKIYVEYFVVESENLPTHTHTYIDIIKLKRKKVRGVDGFLGRRGERSLGQRSQLALLNRRKKSKQQTTILFFSQIAIPKKTVEGHLLLLRNCFV